MAPDIGIRQRQATVVARASPRGHLNMAQVRIPLVSEFQRRQYVGVGGHYHADIVCRVDCKRHKIHCQGNVNTLFL